MKEVGIRLKVGATGLEIMSQLSQSLRAAGVDTTALDAKATELGAELKRLGAEQSLIENFKRQKAATVAAGDAMRDAKARATELGREIGATEAPTTKQVAAFNAARQASRQADQAFEAQRLVLQQLRAQLSSAGVSTDGLARAQIQVSKDSTQARAAVERLEAAYRQVGAAAAQSASTQMRASTEARSGLDDLGRQLQTVRNLAAAAIGGQLFSGLIGDVSKTADAYANLAARIKLVSGEGPAFTSAFQGVFDVATRTNSSLEQTGNLFARIAQAGKTIGVSQADALRLTESINQAVQLGGASAEASTAAVTQLIQGLQSGVLRGDEFNSVMEQAPRLALALADGLGITTGELRKLAEQGGLTASTVIGALKGQSAALQTEFGQLPATVGRALQNLSTEWTRYVGEVDKAHGVSTTVARAIGGLAQNLGLIGTALESAGKAFAAYAALRLADSFSDKARAVAAATEQVRLETIATAENTRVAGANAIAKRGNAAAWGELGTAMRAETTAVVSDTGALGLNTAASVANTGAKRANAAAAAGAAVDLGRVGNAAAGAAVGLGASGEAAKGAGGRFEGFRAAGLSVLSILGRIVGAVAIASLAWDVFKSAGTWIGETAAKLAGYKDRTEELAAAQKAVAAEAKAAADAHAQYAQQATLAKEKALGLNDVSRKVVSSFEELVQKGTSAGEAVQKLAKDLDLGNLQGVKDAVTALDALERKGKITGAQVRQALHEALDGKDLGIFEVNARAAFDGTEQGVRRLRAALDALADESLKRAGTSAQELKTGFNAALNSAINDTDALARTLEGLGVKGYEVGQLLGKSIDREIEAAKTEKALQLVRDRLIELGKQGKFSTDQVADGLAKIGQKADEINPGINSVAEAARKMGIQTREELLRTADDFRKAWDQIRGTTTVTIDEKIKAFVKFRDAAVAANGGVESSEIALQRQILETQARTAGLGEAFTKAMSGANNAIGQTRKMVGELSQELNAAGERLNQLAAGIDGLASTRRANEAVRSVFDPSSGRYDDQGFAVGNDRARITAGGQLTKPDLPGDWQFVGDVRVGQGTGTTGEFVLGNGDRVSGIAVNGQGYWFDKSGLYGSAAQPTAKPSSAASSSTAAAASSNAAVAAKAAASPPSAPTATSLREVRVVLEVAGRSVALLGSEPSVDQFLAALAESKARAGQ